MQIPETTRLWPLAIPDRLVPAKDPGGVRAGLAAVVLLSIATGLGVFALGHKSAPTQIYYPALILITLYADAAWGALSLGVSTLLIWWMWSRGGPLSPQREGSLFLFAGAGFLTIIVCAALRATVMRLRGVIDAQFIAEGALTDAQKRGWLAKVYEKLRPL